MTIATGKNENDTRAERPLYADAGANHPNVSRHITSMMPRNEDEGATAIARGGRHGERRLTKREARGMSMGTTTYGYGEWVTVGRCLWHADFDRCCVAGSTILSVAVGAVGGRWQPRSLFGVSVRSSERVCQILAGTSLDNASATRGWSAIGDIFLAENSER